MDKDIPAFALPSVAPNTENKFNNDNNPSNNNNNGNENVTGAPQLPMWAVILIVVFLLAFFVSIVCFYFYCKRKLKKRKMKKNRILLQGTHSYHPSMQNPSPWEEGWANTGYQHDGTRRSSYLPGVDNNWKQNNFRNTMLRSEMNDNASKNINILRNETETLKKKAPAPPPPEEQTYENLRMHDDTSMTQARRAAPPPPTLQENHEDNNTVVTQATSLKSIPAIMKRTQQETSDYWPVTAPPPRPPKLQSQVIRDDITSATTFATQSDLGDGIGNHGNDDDPSDDDDTEIASIVETVTVAATSVHEDNDLPGDEQTENGLMGILTQWKEHLFDQKNELQDYYNRLTGYVESLVIQPMDSVSNVGVKEIVEHRIEEPHKNARRSKSLRKKRRLPSYPAPPESVMDEMMYKPVDPYDVKGQKKVIKDLKTRLSELEQLLQNTKELENEPEENPRRLNRKKSRSRSLRQQSKKMASQTLPAVSQQRTTTAKPGLNTGTKTLPAKKNDRITMRKLLSQLDKEDGERMLKKIAKVLKVSKQHIGMNMDGSKKVTSLQLARQIHHVMRDVVNPRLRTNMLLAGHAAINLASKLAKSLQTEGKLKIEGNTNEATNLSERITGLVRHMLDMSKQLELRIDSYYKEDFIRFVDGFLLIAMKIMTTAYKFVCIETADVKSKETKKISRIQSLRSTEIHNNLIHKDVAQLSDGLTKLEVLLKSGKIPGLESSAPSSGYYKQQQQSNFVDYSTATSTGSCNSDCEMYSCVSCSTCFPGNNVEGTHRNPYLFPGDSSEKMLPNRLAKESAENSYYGYFRPPIRPNGQRKEADKQCPKCRNAEETSYKDPKLNVFQRPENTFYQPENISETNKDNHEVMLAKYLNELLKSQNDRSALTLPHNINAPREKQTKAQLDKALYAKVRKPSKDSTNVSKSDKKKKDNSKRKHKSSKGSSKKKSKDPSYPKETQDHPHHENPKSLQTQSITNNGRSNPDKDRESEMNQDPNLGNPIDKSITNPETFNHDLTTGASEMPITNSPYDQSIATIANIDKEKIDDCNTPDDNANPADKDTPKESSSPKEIDITFPCENDPKEKDIPQENSNAEDEPNMNKQASEDTNESDVPVENDEPCEEDVLRHDDAKGKNDVNDEVDRLEECNEPKQNEENEIPNKDSFQRTDDFIQDELPTNDTETNDSDKNNNEISEERPKVENDMPSEDSEYIPDEETTIPGQDDDRLNHIPQTPHDEPNERNMPEPENEPIADKEAYENDTNNELIEINKSDQDTEYNKNSVPDERNNFDKEKILDENNKPDEKEDVSNDDQATKGNKSDKEDEFEEDEEPEQTPTSNQEEEPTKNDTPRNDDNPDENSSQSDYDDLNQNNKPSNEDASNKSEVPNQLNKPKKSDDLDQENGPTEDKPCNENDEPVEDNLNSNDDAPTEKDSTDQQNDAENSESDQDNDVPDQDKKPSETDEYDVNDLPDDLINESDVSDHEEPDKDLDPNEDDPAMNEKDVSDGDNDPSKDDALNEKDSPDHDDSSNDKNKSNKGDEPEEKRPNEKGEPHKNNASDRNTESGDDDDAPGEFSEPTVDDPQYRSDAPEQNNEPSEIDEPSNDDIPDGISDQDKDDSSEEPNLEQEQSEVDKDSNDDNAAKKENLVEQSSRPDMDKNPSDNTSDDSDAQSLDHQSSEGDFPNEPDMPDMPSENGLSNKSEDIMPDV